MLYKLPEDIQELIWKQVFKASLDCIIDQHIFENDYEDDIIFITEETKKDVYFMGRVHKYVNEAMGLYYNALTENKVAQLDRYRCHINSSLRQTLFETVYRIAKGF
jgi:hypothetical protein